MPGAIRGHRTTPLNAMGGLFVDPWQSARRTVAVIGFGWAGAAGTTLVAYLALGLEAVPISVGVVVCLAFALALILLHRAWWLGVLSAVPSLFILVGAVQYAPEAALERRGVRESVVVVADTATGFTLERLDGTELKEKYDYNGDLGAPEVGDRFDIIRDPEGEVPLAEADDVDSSGRMGGLITGVVAWTLMAALAGRRGHLRRRRGLDSTENVPL